MHGVRFKRKGERKTAGKATAAQRPSAISAAAPLLEKQKGTATVREEPTGKIPSKKVENQKKVEDQHDKQGQQANVETVGASPRKKQKLDGTPTEAAEVPVEPQQQEGNQTPPAVPTRDGRKSRASLGAAVAQAVSAASAKNVPEYPGSEDPGVPFHEGLTAVLEDKRLVQLMRRICRHEQKTVDATFEDHQYIAIAAEMVLKGWVRAVQERLKQDHSIVDTTQAIVEGSSSPAAGRVDEEDEEDERREALLTLRSNFLSEEQAWQRLIAAQEGVLERDVEERAQAARPDPPPPSESAGVDAALEETRRKLAFQAEALCQLVSGVSDVCRRAEQASKDLAQDFSARFTSILPQGSPRTLINRFMSYHPASGPS